MSFTTHNADLQNNKNNILIDVFDVRQNYCFYIYIKIFIFDFIYVFNVLLYMLLLNLICLTSIYIYIKLDSKNID